MVAQFGYTCSSSLGYMMSDGKTCEMFLFRNKWPALRGFISCQVSIDNMRSYVIDKVTTENSQFQKGYGFGFATSNTGRLCIEFIEIGAEHCAILGRGVLRYEKDNDELARIFEQIAGQREISG